MPFQISGRGWEMLITRLGLQSKTGHPTRTYSSYQVYVDGTPVGALAGSLCERTGPGDNTSNGVHNHLRIHEGRYPLSTQFGDHYKSVNYGSAEAYPMPGFLLMRTGTRTAILVYPGHQPTRYISSIGCLNPTAALSKSKDISFVDSRSRVIALIDSLRQYDPSAFAPNRIGHNTPISGAAIVIDGEPMNAIT